MTPWPWAPQPIYPPNISATTKARFLIPSIRSGLGWILFSEKYPEIWVQSNDLPNTHENVTFFMYEHFQKYWYFWMISLKVSTWYIRTYLRYLFFVLFIHTLCGALVLQSVKLKRSLGDTAIWGSKLESVIWFVALLRRFLDMLVLVWVQLGTPYLKYIRR